MFGNFHLPKIHAETDFGRKFKIVYCTLCRELGQSFEGLKVVNNYDFTLWALFIDLLLHNRDEEIEQFFCPYTFKKKIRYSKATYGIIKAGYYTKLFFKLKIIDFWQDLPFSKLRFNGLYEKFLEEQAFREKEKEKTLEYYAEISGALLGIITADSLLERNYPLAKSLIAYELAFYLGRFIYLLDALKDFKNDKLLSRFNGILATYPGLKEKVDNQSLLELNFVLFRHLEVISSLLKRLEVDYYTETMTVLQNSYFKTVQQFIKSLPLKEDDYGILPESWRVLTRKP